MVMGLVANDIGADYPIAMKRCGAISDSWGNSRNDLSLISKGILSCNAASNLE
jgi:hypothetical protein